MWSPHSVPANPWRRLGGFVIDGFLIGLVAQLAQAGANMMSVSATLSSGHQQPASPFFAPALAIALSIIYPTYFQAGTRQATPGQQAAGVKVVDMYGNRIGYGTAFIRSLVGVASAIPLYAGYIVGFFSGRRQTVHDIVAGTLVVMKEKS